jgi:eukaryotic-like serine/threonine-protein kinase
MALIILAALMSSFYIGRLTGPKAGIRKVVPTETTFKRLTFRRGYISSASFAPDGQSVVYSASWVGAPEELFVTRPQNPVSRSLGIKAALLSISSTGEMAVLLNPRYIAGWQRTGTLARVPIDGGAPREIATDVQDADWSRDGKNLAVVRNVGGSYRLEYPIGKLLYETNGWLHNIHISPNGELIAFMDHPTPGDDRGTVNVVDSQGKVTKLTREFASESGLSWSLDGKEIWFTGSTEGSNEQPVYAVTLQGQQRVVAAMVGNLILHDIDAKGTALVTRDSRRREIYVLPPGDSREKEMSWFDWSFVRYLSEDGKTLIFDEQGAGGGPNYSVFLRKTDGSPAVKLGEGFGFAMSPDGKFVLSQLPNDFSHLTLLPTGAGESKIIRVSGFTFRGPFPAWFPDNKRILTGGYKSGQRFRWWIYDLTTNKLTPVTPEGIVGTTPLIHRSQMSILAQSANGGFTYYSLQGEQSRTVSGLETGDIPLRWTSDGQGVFVAEGTQIPVRVLRVDLNNGKRTLWKEITPSDMSGISGLMNIVITPDGKSYAYTYRRVLSDLYLVPGLQ